MGIHEDARQGALTNDKLAEYIKSNPNIINEQDPSDGLTPLAAATVGGYTEVVDLLLKKGAKADAPSRDGETPLLLAAWKTSNNGPRIIQLLLTKTPASSVDATCPIAENNTPLMYAIKKKDIESIRLLRKANASLTLKNKDGVSAEEIAKVGDDKAVIRALNPEKEQSDLTRLSTAVLSFLLFVVAWVKDAVMGRKYGLNPKLNPRTNQLVNGSEKPDKAKFVQNVDNYIKKNPVLERFFKDKKDYIKEFTRKAADLENDPTTPLGSKDLLPKTIAVSLHQQVIYCDDSSSMKREGRWEAQKQLVKRITQITTRILPDGEGVALRFINQNVDNASSLTPSGIRDILEPLSWAPNGNTEIGTYLRSKILEPLVYSKLETKCLDRPLLISVITDGMPSVEKNSEFVDAIVECGNKLVAAEYPRNSVKFMVGQIGTAQSATAFLDSIRNNPDIADVMFCTSEKLDAKFSDFHENQAGLDRWLIETLFSPIKDRDEKKDQ